MPTVDDLKESKYLTKGDVGNGKLLTIKEWKKEDVSMENQPASMKYVLYFDEEKKGLVLNNTNGKRIQSVAGSADFDDWAGTKVVLYNDPDVEFAGKTVGGIRIRAPKNQQQEEQDIPF